MPQSIVNALPAPPTPGQIPQNLPYAPIPQVSANALQPPQNGVQQPPAPYIPPPPPPPDMSGYFQQFIDQEKQKTQIVQKAGQEASAEIKENRKKREAIEPPKPPELAPAPKPQNSDPFQTFGSAAGWLAVFGSMLTRAPLTSSLNAAAGAMNAAKQNNAAEFQQNMDVWKANTENALKLHQFALDTYREDMEKLKDGDESVKTNVDVLAHSLQDDSMIAALKAGSEEAYRLYAARIKQGQAAAEAADKTYQIGLALKDIQDHDKDWTPMQKARRYAEATTPSVMNTEIRADEKEKEDVEKEKKAKESGLTPEGLAYAAWRYKLTGVEPPTGMGGTQAKIQIMEEARKLPDKPGEDDTSGQKAMADVQSAAQYGGVKREESALGLRAGQLGQIAPFTRELVDDTKELSKKVWRGDLVPVNEAALLAMRQSSNVEESKLAANIYSIASEYSKALNPSGANTDSGRAEAYANMREAKSQPAFAAILDQMSKNLLKEENVGRRALGQKEEGTLKTYSPADYKKALSDKTLKSGDHFLTSDGVEHTVQ